MTPRERYFAEQRAAAEREQRMREEAARQAVAREREAKLREQKRIFEAKERRRKEAERRRRQKEARIFRTRLLVFSVIFFVILAVALLCVLVSFLTTKVPADEETVTASYNFSYVSDGAETLAWKQAKEDSVKNGILYVDFSELAEAVGFTITGSGDERRFVTEDGDEAVVLTVGDVIAYVNSFAYRMESVSAYSAGKNILLPLSFVSECMKGITVTVDEEKYAVALEKTDEISFLIKSADTLPPIDGDTDDTGGIDEDEIPEVTFTSDLSEYEMYMNPEDRDAYLVLVNAWNLLDESHVPDDLVEVTNTRKDGRNTQKLRLYAAKSLEALFTELFACGYDDLGPTGHPVSVTSAYRSYSYQSQLFNSYVEREMNNNTSLTRAEAEAIVETYSARPGTSEHQTGLCIDMHNLGSAMKAFADEEAYEWLTENAWKFGFVLRFPDGKTDITGITYEPWHYRYVGRYHAYRMNELGLCLEEYIEYLENE